MSPDITGDHIYKCDNYPTIDQNYLDIAPNVRNHSTMCLLVDLLGEYARTLIEEPSEEKPYDCAVDYDYWDAKVNDGANTKATKYKYRTHVGLWLDGKYYLTKYFDHDTYGPDEPVHVQFGIDYIITGDLYKALREWANDHRESVERILNEL